MPNQLMDWEMETSRINSRGIREVAGAIQASTAGWNEIVAEMSRCLQIMEGHWEGPAADCFLKQMRQLLITVGSASELYTTMSDEMLKAAEVYEQAHGTAMQLASNIEVANWAQV